MKQFNLEEYLKNPSKKVVTRRGKAVKIHCTNHESNRPIIAQVEGSDYSVSFTEDGKAFIGNNVISKDDLFFAPEKHEVWTNVYRRSNEDAYGIGFGCTYSSEEEAKEGIVPSLDCVATVKIEWEE